jgi:UDP-N-acetylglucosamine 2-epimerase (non-hydrolysing)
MAPVAEQLAAIPERFDTRICVTGQHREMLDQVLGIFALSVAIDLDLMRPRQELADLTSRLLTAIDTTLRAERPDLVLVQGDTTTALAAGLAAFYNKIPLGHVEAGLRTDSISAPWPEELNRRITSLVANLHFAPTDSAKANLLAEGVDEKQIHVTGNTVIDSLLHIIERIHVDEALRHRLDGEFSFLNSSKKMILVTGHRRESFGPGFENICQALRELAENNPDVDLVYPVHLNPQVQQPVRHILNLEGGVAGGRIHLIDPVEYLQFVYLMDRAYFIITDSGGIQEEAPSLKKPVLVMRDTTERPEAVEMGAAKLVGTKKDTIIGEASRLLRDQEAYRSMIATRNPYGDGQAAKRIVSILQDKGLWKKFVLSA